MAVGERNGGVGWLRAVAATALTLVAASILWGAGSAYACDPVTGEGCDVMNPSSPAPANPPPAQPADPAPQPRPETPSPPAQPRGEPFIPPDAQLPPGQPLTQAPASPASPPAPAAVPEPVPAAGSTNESGGDDDGGPDPLDLLLPGALVLGGVAVAAGAGQRGKEKEASPPEEAPRPPPPPPRQTPAQAIAEYQNRCADVCWAREQEARADADLAAAEASVREIDAAWQRARDYLRDQLRQDVMRARRNVMLALPAALLLGGLFGGPMLALGMATGSLGTQMVLWKGWLEPTTSDEVLSALPDAQRRIDDMRRDALEQARAKIRDAKERQERFINVRHAADSRMSYLRGFHSGVTFPDCACL
jgi:hypothetical protein